MQVRFMICDLLCSSEKNPYSRLLQTGIIIVLIAVSFSFIGISHVVVAETGLPPGGSSGSVENVLFNSPGQTDTRYQGVLQAASRLVISPSGNSIASPGAVSGQVMGPVSVPDVNLPNRMGGIKKVSPPVGKIKEEGMLTIESAGQTTRVSVASSGTQGNSGSGFPSISADGRYVAFHSNANNLVPGDTNGVSDVFVHDRNTGKTTRVSVASSGKQGYGHA